MLPSGFLATMSYLLNLPLLHLTDISSPSIVYPLYNESVFIISFALSTPGAPGIVPVFSAKRHLESRILPSGYCFTDKPLCEAPPPDD